MGNIRHFSLLGLSWLMIAPCGGVLAAEPDLDLSVDAPEVEAAPAKAKPKAKGKLKSKRKAEGVWEFKLDEVRASAGAYVSDPAPSTSLDLYGAVSAKMQKGAWEFALGARADAQYQGGSPDFSRTRLDYTENFARWRNEEMRVTVGTQNVLWGRVDEISPIDRMSRVDLTRLILDKQPDRRRAVPAVVPGRYLRGTHRRHRPPADHSWLGSAGRRTWRWRWRRASHQDRR